MRRDHALALGAHGDEADLDAEPLFDEGDVRTRGGGEVGERLGLGERLPQPANVSYTGSAWWKSLWCAGNSSVSVPSGRR